MSSKGLLFFSVFACSAIGALAFPCLGVYGYIADYCLNPAHQWWGRPFASMGIRFSYTLALATMAGIFLQRNKLMLGKGFLYRQEWCLLFFLVVLWFVYLISPATIGRYSITDHPSVKFTKIVVFTLMMTHVITDLKKLSGLFWVLVVVSLILGVKAHNVPYHAFVGGRLEGIGGVDFAESNFFAAFMAAMLPIIAIQFLRSPWYGKMVCFASGAFTANAVVLCRSRGAFVGLVAGALASVIFAPRKHRKTIIILLIIGILGFIYVSDPSFIKRILTISVEKSHMDESSFSRVRLWKAGLKIFLDNPLGIGPGNWYQTIVRYLPEYAGKDSHNTYVKCLVELGFAGFSLFVCFLCLAYANLRTTYKEYLSLENKEADGFMFFYFAIVVSLAIFLTCALTITMIYTELLWVLLMLPVCLRRSFDNYQVGGIKNQFSGSSQQ